MHLKAVMTRNKIRSHFIYSYGYDSKAAFSIECMGFPSYSSALVVCVVLYEYFGTVIECSLFSAILVGAFSLAQM